MAYGQIQNFVAIPQPGTTNTPIPAILPAFVPVTCTVTDTYGLAVGAEMTTILTMIGKLIAVIGDSSVPPGSLAASLNGINSSLTRIADTKKALASSLSNLNIAIGALAVARSHHASVLNHSTSSNVQSNNYYQAASPDKPSLPTEEKQLSTAVSSGAKLDSAGKVQSAAVSVSSKAISTVNTWILNSGIYQTVGNWLGSYKDSIVALLPPSVQSALDKTKGGPT